MSSVVSTATVWIDGRFVPAAEATVSVFDRSFLYGDGLFETIRVHRATLLHWDRHLNRLQAGAEALRIRIPFSVAEITAAAHAVMDRSLATDGLLRLTLSRGIGNRGYSPRNADHPLLLMVHQPLPSRDPSLPEGWTLATSRFRLPARDPLSHWKTANKLIQVLARAEAEDVGADEALLLNSDGHLAETASSNIFWIADGVVSTPPLETGALAGVTRSVVLALTVGLGVQCRESVAGVNELLTADGVFVTLSSWGIVPVTRLDGSPLRASPITQRLQRAFWEDADRSGTP